MDWFLVAVLAMQAPQAVAVDAEGRIFFSDPVARSISRIDGGKVEVLAAGPRRDRSPLAAVRDLGVQGDGTIVAADSATGAIYVLGGAAPTAVEGLNLQVPTGLAIAPDGWMLVCDQRLGRVVARTRDGAVTTLAELDAPRDVDLLPDGRVVILSPREDQVSRIETSGLLEPIVRGRPFAQPNSIVFWPARDRLIVSDGYGPTLWEIPPEGGEPVAWLTGAPLVRPAGLAVGGEHLYLADPGAGQVFRLTAAGAVEPLLPDRD